MIKPILETRNVSDVYVCLYGFQFSDKKFKKIECKEEGKCEKCKKNHNVQNLQ